MNSKLHNAIEQGDLPAVVAALDRGADIEACDMHGAPGLPLRTACFRGHEAIVIELIQRGADIHAANADGASAPLRTAARGKHWHIVKLLLAHGVEKPPGLELPGAEIELPAAETGERRRCRERRANNYGPPRGLRERRDAQERRVTFVQEVELSDHQWSSYFAQVRAKSPQQHDVADVASQVLERVRD
jgi:hypothetical protein